MARYDNEPEPEADPKDGGPFDFIVGTGTRYGLPRYGLALPHQCDYWEVTAEDGYETRDDISKGDALALAVKFGAELDQAIELLRALL